MSSRGDCVPKLGTVTTDIAIIDQKQKNESDTFVIDVIARREQLESDGITCQHEKQQPVLALEFSENFIGTEIEQLWYFTEHN